MGNILVFKIGAACFGLETAQVKAVVKDIALTDDKNYPDFANGVVEYEGQKIFVVDFGEKLFQQTSTPFTDAKVTENTPSLTPSATVVETRKTELFSSFVGRKKEKNEKVRSDEVLPPSQGRQKSVSGLKMGKCRVDFLLVSFQDGEFAIPIDEVINIFQISEKDIKPIPPFAVMYMSKNFFKGVFSADEKLVLLLDVGNFFKQETYLTD